MTTIVKGITCLLALFLGTACSASCERCEDDEVCYLEEGKVTIDSGETQAASISCCTASLVTEGEFNGEQDGRSNPYKICEWQCVRDPENPDNSDPEKLWYRVSYMWVANATDPASDWVLESTAHSNIPEAFQEGENDDGCNGSN